MFNKDDKVKVIAEDNYFAGYTGTVVKEEKSDFETDNGKEITEVTVKLDVDLDDENKDVLEIFYSDELELVAKNESLNEEVEEDEENDESDFVDWDDVYNEIKEKEIFNKTIITMPIDPDEPNDEENQHEIEVLYHGSESDYNEFEKDWIEDMVSLYPGYFLEVEEIIANPEHEEAAGYFFIDGCPAEFVMGNLNVNGERVYESLTEDASKKYRARRISDLKLNKWDRIIQCTIIDTETNQYLKYDDCDKELNKKYKARKDRNSGIISFIGVEAETNAKQYAEELNKNMINEEIKKVKVPQEVTKTVYNTKEVERTYYIQNIDGRYIEDSRHIDFCDNVEKAEKFKTREEARKRIAYMKSSRDWQEFDRGDKPHLKVVYVDKDVTAGESLTEEQIKEIFKVVFVEDTDDCVCLNDDGLENLCKKYNLKFLKSLDRVPYTFFVKGTENNVKRLCNTKNYNTYGIEDYYFANPDEIDDYGLDESLKEIISKNINEDIDTTEEINDINEKRCREIISKGREKVKRAWADEFANSPSFRQRWEKVCNGKPEPKTIYKMIRFLSQNEMLYDDDDFQTLLLFGCSDDEAEFILYYLDESLKESLVRKEKEKPEDLIHKYIYLEDLDGKEIPAWNFASRIAAAENLEEGNIEELAEQLGYKLILVEAPNMIKVIIAAKEVKLDDIKEEYADFLLGNAVIREFK